MAGSLVPAVTKISVDKVARHATVYSDICWWNSSPSGKHHTQNKPYTAVAFSSPFNRTFWFLHWLLTPIKSNIVKREYRIQASKRRSSGDLFSRPSFEDRHSDEWSAEATHRTGELHGSTDAWYLKFRTCRATHTLDFWSLPAFAFKSEF